jgi:superoxide dismutase, Cu-Zn family
MKQLTILGSLALMFSLLTACDRKPDQPGEHTDSERGPMAEIDKQREGMAADAERRDKDRMDNDRMNSDRNDKREAEANIKAANGMKLEGEVDLKETADGVEIVAKIEDAAPGMHGFHIHEKGDCSDLPGKSMGEHFNPEGKPHMLPHEGDARHLGDLGNIEVGDDGKGKVRFTLKGASLKEGDSRSLLGKSFVIHERKDVGQERQPAGDSGEPIACGVIKKA